MKRITSLSALPCRSRLALPFLGIAHGRDLLGPFSVLPCSQRVMATRALRNSSARRLVMEVTGRLATATLGSSAKALLPALLPLVVVPALGRTWPRVPLSLQLRGG